MSISIKCTSQLSPDMDRHDIPGSSGPAAPTRYNRRLVEQDVFGYKRVLVSGDQNPSKYVKQSKPRDRPHRPRLSSIVDIVISGKNSVAIGREVGENVVEEEGGLPLQGNIITDDAVLPLETESSSSHNAEDLEPSHTDCSESEQVTTEKAYGDVTQANEGNEGGLEDSNASIHEERQEVEGNDSMEESIQSDVEGSDTDESIEGDSGNSDIDETVQYDAEDKDVDEYGSVHSENYEFLYDGCPIREDQSVILISLYASRHHLSETAPSHTSDTKEYETKRFLVNQRKKRSWCVGHVAMKLVQMSARMKNVTSTRRPHSNHANRLLFL